MEKSYGTWDYFTRNLNDGMAGGPLILFNMEGDTIILTQMSQCNFLIIFLIYYFFICAT
jgi:hypothetical protein